MGGETSVPAFTVLGTGTGALVGNDLTDLGDDGVETSYSPPTLAGFDAEFFANSEPGFNATAGSEGAFNVFDNAVGSGQAKWCCGDSGVFPDPGMIVGADFSNTLAKGSEFIVLKSFTVTSGNDTPARDPVVWQIQGSSDTTTGLDGTWTTIFDHSSGGSDWGGTRNEVIRYSPADGDTLLTFEGFKAFRMVTTETAGGGSSGAFFQFNELEFFGSVVPEPTTLLIWSLLAGLGVGLGWRRRK